jgi:hypothetical protein
MKHVFTVLTAVMVVMLLAAPAMADPYQGQVLKFQQKPLNGPKYFGHDESSMAILDPGDGAYYGQFMADDFADESTTPVVHVTWWGSYMGPPTDPNRVQRFLIAFESDVPAPDIGGFSHPNPLDRTNLYQTVTRAPVGVAPGAGQFTEQLVPGVPAGAEALYMYNAELAIPRPQEPGKVQWLKIVALVNPLNADEVGIEWGWHNRDYTVQNPLAAGPPVPFPGERDLGPILDDDGNLLPVWHFQDDAVLGQIRISPLTGTNEWDVYQTAFQPQNYGLADGPTEITRFSKDLAFELYTVPEPGTVAMLGGAGLIGLVAFARRRRKG